MREEVSPAIRSLCLFGAAVAPFNLIVSIPFGGLTMRPLHLWAVMLLLVYIATEPGELARSVGPATLSLVVFCACITLSTILATPPELRGRGLADSLLLLLNVLAFAVTVAALSGRPALWNRVAVITAVSAIGAAAILTYRARHLSQTGNTAGTDSELLSIGTVRGTYNMAFTAGAAAFAIFSRRTAWILGAFAALAAYTSAGVLSLARGAWLGFTVGLLVALVVGVWRTRGESRALRLTGRTLATLIVMAFSAAVTILSTPRGPALVVDRVATATVTDRGTGFSRLQMWHALSMDVMRSPMFGHGAASYRRISQMLGSRTTISENFGLEMLHAGGVTAVIWLLIAGALALSHVVRATDRRDRLAPALACLAAVVAVGVGTLTNPAAWDGLFWLLLGLAASA